MHCTLLVTCQYMWEFELIYCVIQSQYGASWISEDKIHAFIFQAFKNSLSTIHPQCNTSLFFQILYRNIYIFTICFLLELFYDAHMSIVKGIYTPFYYYFMLFSENPLYDKGKKIIISNSNIK